MIEIQAGSPRGVYRLVGEFLLIVTGVTVALAADSLWGLRQDRVREREYLQQLGADLEATVELSAALAGQDGAP